MSINVSEVQEEYFSIEDVIVQYANIKITHANDNKAPIKTTLRKMSVWLVIIVLSIAIALL